ncbi:MAG TPA: lipase family protein [Acidimicrobiales bacterium]|nr:lipase family protein [Acidimicrobiales bacterium]
MRPSPGVLAAAAVTVALLAGCSDGAESSGGAGKPEAAAEAEATTSLETFTGADFYAVPDPLPEGEHGTLIRYRPHPDLAVDGATSYLVMYLSESVPGDPIAVTGTVSVPDTPAPDGGRPIVSLAHGTTGIADECAPSRNSGGAGSLGLGLFTQQGYIVANTDYEGMGTPGRHPYLVGESEGRSVLDAALAARQLPDADAGTALGIFGYSQGGHGALWAGELAAEWAPDLDLVGTAAGAPATELPLILGAGASRGVAGFVYMMVAGLHAAYPDAPLSALLTPEGEAALDTVDQGCTAQVLGAFAGRDSSTLFQPGGPQAEPWATLAAENNPGTVATEAPILLVNSAADDVVPNALVDLLYQRMCGEGQVVERRVYELGQGHGAAAPGAYQDAVAWLEGRFGGTEPTSTCP